VPRYETFDVLDERRLAAFLCREEPALGLKSLTGKLLHLDRRVPHPPGGGGERADPAE
jgi:hypothetical protein